MEDGREWRGDGLFHHHFQPQVRGKTPKNLYENLLVVVFVCDVACGGWNDFWKDRIALVQPFGGRGYPSWACYTLISSFLQSRVLMGYERNESHRPSPSSVAR